MSDLIDRQSAIDEVKRLHDVAWANWKETRISANTMIDALKDLPSAQPGQRYTEEELRVFQHGISLSLLSKRSAQHWRYDEDTATEIKFLERLYDKVGANMRGEQECTKKI
jgi:hypothetical protein